MHQSGSEFGYGRNGYSMCNRNRYAGQTELFKILKCPGVKGLSGKYVSQPDMDFVEFKKECSEEGIQMTFF